MIELEVLLRKFDFKTIKLILDYANYALYYTRLRLYTCQSV